MKRSFLFLGSVVAAKFRPKGIDFLARASKTEHFSIHNIGYQPQMSGEM